ncbi:hypothetical protein ACM7HL_34275, partial [Pseudomonas aeruginosa]
ISTQHKPMNKRFLRCPSQEGHRGSQHALEGKTMKLSTHRLIQIHNLADDMSGRALVAHRGAVSLARIGNQKGSRYMAARAARFASLADACVARLERDA